MHLMEQPVAIVASLARFDDDRVAVLRGHDRLLCLEPPIVLGAQRGADVVHHRPQDFARLRAGPDPQDGKRPAQQRVAFARERLVRGDQQLLLVLGGRIVEIRSERDLLLLGDARDGVQAFAIRPMLPLLLQPVQRGDVVRAQRRDV